MDRIVEHKIEIQKEQPLVLELSLRVVCRKFLDSWFLSLCYVENKECEELEHMTSYGSKYKTLFLKRLKLDVSIYYCMSILGKEETIETYKEKIDKKIEEFKAYFEYIIKLK